MSVNSKPRTRPAECPPPPCPPTHRVKMATWPFGTGAPGSMWDQNFGWLKLHQRWSTPVDKMPRAAEPLLGYEFLYAFDGAQDVYVTPEMLREYIGYMGGGGGIPDAPADDQYMRTQGAWVKLTHIDGGTY